MEYVESVRVDDEDDQLPMATITVKDLHKVWTKDLGVVKGKPIAIALGHTANMKRIFSGSINFIDASYPVEGYPTLNISCIDIARKLTIPRKARSWKKRKISDIITLMHKEAGVKVIVEDTKVVLDNINQEEGSNLDFIIKWKKHLGAKYYKTNVIDTYYFGTKPRNIKATETLSYMTGGHEILSFSPTYQEVEKPEEITATEIGQDGKKTTAKKQTQPTYASIGSGNGAIGKAQPKSK